MKSALFINAKIILFERIIENGAFSIRALLKQVNARTFSPLTKTFAFGRFTCAEKKPSTLKILFERVKI